jgi:hypothetical protein
MYEDFNKYYKKALIEKTQFIPFFIHKEILSANIKISKGRMAVYMLGREPSCQMLPLDGLSGCRNVPLALLISSYENPLLFCLQII